MSSAVITCVSVGLVANLITDEVSFKKGRAQVITAMIGSRASHIVSKATAPSLMSIITSIVTSRKRADKAIFLLVGIVKPLSINSDRAMTQSKSMEITFLLEMFQ